MTAATAQPPEWTYVIVTEIRRFSVRATNTAEAIKAGKAQAVQGETIIAVLRSPEALED